MLHSIAHGRQEVQNDHCVIATSGELRDGGRTGRRRPASDAGLPLEFTAGGMSPHRAVPGA